MSSLSSSLPASAANAETSLRRDKLAISGMRCAACAQIIEYRLRQLPGVEQVDLHYSSARVEMRWQPEKISLSQIVEAVCALGYRALPLAKAESEAAAEAKAKKMLWWRVFVAGFAMMQVMMYAFPAWLQPVPSVDGDLTPDIDRLLKLASFSLSVPVFLFSAWPFYMGAWRDLRNRHIGMDVPVAIGVIATFAASVYATWQGGAVYYDSMIMFVFLLLLARRVEAKVQHSSSAALRELTNLVPPQALVCRQYPSNQESESVLAASIQVGDVVLLLPGAQVPVDGIVLQGSGACDEALMTGEAQPVLKTPGSQVMAGAMNLAGRLLVRAEQVGEATRLSHLVAMMENAASQKPALVQLADRHASTFLTVILALSLLSGLVWWQIDAARALPIALTVLVITCPCALSLATPAVMAAVTGQLAKHGVLLARGRAVEALARASHFVFDKTGTLTEGKLLCQQIHYLQTESSPVEQAQVADLAAHIARNSLHPAAQAIAALSKQSSTAELTGLDDIEEIVGQGLQTRYQGKTYRLGSLAFVQALHGLALPAHTSETSLLAFGNQEQWLALFELSDSVRADAQNLLAALQAAGKQVWILSGDRSVVVAKLAQQLGVPAAQALGDLQPQQKYEQVLQLQQQSKLAKVAVVGDGMNDGPVLSLADVSIAMGQGAPITQARSDVVLISSSLADLQFAWLGTQRALALIRQNLCWAIAYNVVAIPSAVFGWLAPWHAALGMSLSSVLVVVNSLRMLREEKTPRSKDA